MTSATRIARPQDCRNPEHAPSAAASRKAYAKSGLFLLFILLLLPSCAIRPEISSMERSTFYLPQTDEKNLAERFAPVFAVPGGSEIYDRIGSPAAVAGENGSPTILVDPEKPVIYHMKQKFSTDKGEYTNLVYRIHFKGIPWSLFPFHLTAGRNVGLMVIMTLDNRDKPVLVTSVHTCGCYLAILPTSELPEDALPEKFRHEPLSVYGETLPGLLAYDPEAGKERLVVTLRPGEHRVAHMEFTPQSEQWEKDSPLRPIHLAPMDELEKIPYKNGTLSFFHQEGIMKGYARGSVKLLETLFLSAISLDLFVGTDKAYKDTALTENPFYTSLKPWNRCRSNMWYFHRFLRFWGWNL